ncbi:trifunctional serine/threonine-protein kinase/ATP-binding protein/sensor histidine kinase [Aquabacterium sp.]|uniref:trifunctional serine/threonine-protein kinase/ATP-binding protein/sensor histidine kinase n=1 Tax=Aquabacterium sp. TaxID=1872578 RepID=UPI002C9D11B2|nr:AAA family ATPase [Aquabacterium sp.]HSW09129.1 AAA family ATPase [Aquabacterium sp.]
MQASSFALLAADGTEREILYESGTTRVLRLRPRSGPGVIHKQPLGPDAAERLRHESDMLTRLAGIEGVPSLAAEHPGVIALEDCGGRPLAQALGPGPLEVLPLLALALRLARTLSAVHHRGVLHHNINPAHILLRGAQRLPLLIDFHLATTFFEEHPQADEIRRPPPEGVQQSGRATCAGGPPGFTQPRDIRDIRGDLSYLAPEQTGRTDHGVDQRADLYSLGATLYELATGRPPFEAQDPLRLIHDHLARLPEAPATLRPGLPEMLSGIVLRLLEKEPDRRYQSAEGLAHDLARLLRSVAQGSHEPFQLGERDFGLRLSAPSRLVGRAAEVGALRLALSDVTQGASRVVLVSGAPGAGKTALINELKPWVSAQHGWFIAGKFDQYRQDAPTATVQALRALGRLLLAEPERELVQQRAAILQALGAQAGLITAALPEFAVLLGPQPEAAATDPIGAESRLRLTALALLRAIVSPQRPVVMVLDGLQWAGAASIRFIEAVLADAKLPGLLVVGAYREGEVDAAHPLATALPRWARMDPAPVLLPLPNLPLAELGTLLMDMMRMPAAQAAALAQAVGVHTGGNPYDTVELINALRRDGTLTPSPDGWQWDATTLQRRSGQVDVVNLLSQRIAKLPPARRSLLETMACLGGELKPDLLAAATGLPASELEELLSPLLDGGLLVQEPAGDHALRFRHDHVQQVARDGLEPARRQALQLSLARRLAPLQAFATIAAEQYLPVAAQVHDPDERRRVVSLLRGAAAQAHRVANHNTVERFLAAAIGLLNDKNATADTQMLAALEIERHAVLYSLGRLDEADGVYRSIERNCHDAVDLAEVACTQVRSLTNRNRPHDAMALGMALLQRLELTLPPRDLGAEIERQLDGFKRWVTDQTETCDLTRPQAKSRRVQVAAKLANVLLAPAFSCNPMMRSWLTLESQRLWVEHGPTASLVATLGDACNLTVALRQDYRCGYAASRYALAVGQTHGYEPETSQTRFAFATFAAHWFEPLQECAVQAQRARESLLRSGDLQYACFTYYTSTPSLLDCAPTLDTCAAEVDAGLAFAARTGNDHTALSLLAYRQLLRALRGETHAPGSFADASFDEETHLAHAAVNPTAVANFHITRALCAALFGHAAELARHAAAGYQLLHRIPANYRAAQLRFLQALVAAERVRSAAPDARAAPLAELDAYRDWLALRAADAPFNFGHLFSLVEAERAWAIDDFRGAACAFDTALREVAPRQRPWHQALITERAGLFHLTHGMGRTGDMLLAQARSLYAAWGAHAKVRQLEQTHRALLVSPAALRDRDPGHSSQLTANSIDTLAVLRASQALSSETSLARLTARVVELLGTLTGATQVQLALWDEHAKDWFVAAQDRPDAAPLGIEEAGARGLLPLSAFRYAERTREPLLVEDATHDDRFASDPYLRGADCCSLLVVPILKHGATRAMLVLENGLSRGAFTADRLDAVMLITGQLAVSLANAQLYEQLERRVQERTQELQHAQTQLLASARLAGMAEIATNVLHNVGNALNSVNVSAGLVSTQLRTSKLKGLARAVELMDEHPHDLGEFLTRDDKGRQLPGYLRELAQALEGEHEAMAGELGVLEKSIDHIKDVVATQQSYAGPSSVVESLRFDELLDDALRMHADALTRHKVAVVKNIAVLPLLPLDRHRLMQILVNLISNARHAVDDAADRSPCITLGATLVDAAEGRVLRITVADNGEGIAPENLTRVFAHSFTTRENGHGFGLHSSVLAAQEMGGRLAAHSDGLGHGATFTLDIPIT